VIERLQNPSLRETFVPNSLPTTPEIAYDTGLSQLGRALAANPYANSTGASEVFNARLGDISKHADDYLQQMNRQNLSYDPAVVVRDYRQNVMTPFRAENDLNAININPDSLKKTFEDLLSAHSGNEQIQGFIKSNVKNIFPESTINRLPNETYEIAISDAPTFNRVWNARQGVDSTLFSPEFATLARDKYSSNALNNAAMKMRTAMNESLVDAKPEFADNLKNIMRQPVMKMRY
jgi:hypothetical protein